MNEIVKIGDATLYHGDCLEILPNLDKVDAVVTDPPFNSGRVEIANDSLTSDEWKVFCGKFSKTINASNIIVEVGKNDKEMRSALDCDHEYRWAICLNYTNAMRQGAVGYSNTGLVYWYGEGMCHKRFMDRIDAPLENTKRFFEHPSPKTTQHYERLVDMFTLPDGVVCDPFMGSGITGVACANLSRKFIGIEIERKYFDIACERIDAAYAQGRLFV